MSDPRVPRTRGPLARARRLVALSLVSFVIAPAAASAQFTPSEGAFGDSAMVSYRLTAERLDPFIAAVHAIDALGDEGGMAALEEMDDDAGLEEVVAALDAEPGVREALESAGISSREYVTFMLALVRASFSSLLMSMGGEAALDEVEDEVLRDNIRFYLEHEEVFEALTAEGGGG